MKQALKVTKIGFDTLENESEMAIAILETKLFIDEPGKTAFVKVGEYLRSQEVHLYLGWNDEVYPKFKVEKVSLG